MYTGTPKLVLSAYSQTTNKPYCCILLDVYQNTPKNLRAVTDIFDNEITVYLQVISKKGQLTS